MTVMITLFLASSVDIQDADFNSAVVSGSLQIIYRLVLQYIELDGFHSKFGLHRVENRVLIIISVEFCRLTDHVSDNQLTDRACDSSLAVCYVHTLSSSAYQLRIRSGFGD